MLSDILPRAELQARMGGELIVAEFGLDAISKIAALKPNDVFGLGCRVWMEIVERKLLPVDPQQFSEMMGRSEPRLHRAISNTFNIIAVRDVYYAKCWKDRPGRNHVAAELLVAHLYPSFLHLADVMFNDLSRPVQPRQARFPGQTHRGLGLFGEVNDNLTRQAAALGCDRITLTAATSKHVPFFEQYGFIPDGSEATKFGLSIGHGIHMERPVVV